MNDEQRLEHFGWLLVDLVYDFSVAAVVYRDYLQHESIPKDGPMFQGVSRMCKFSAIISICKLHDALKDNGLAVASFPAEIQLQIKEFRRFVADKKVFTLRSKFAAHNFDDFANYSYEDGDRLFSELVGSTLGGNIDFFEFVNPSNHEKSNGSLSYFASLLRDHVKTLVTLRPRV